MQTWIVWTTKPVSDTELRQFAEADGGYWNEAVGDEAVIERGHARVFLSAAPADDEANVMADDVARASSQLGAKPASMLSIRIGHAEGSVLLAEEVSAKAIRLWRGLLDRNIG